MAPDVTFGQRLRQLRRDKGLSQRDLADRVKIDFTYLSKLENDRMQPPSPETIAALAVELDADVDELTVLAGKIAPDLAEMLSKDLESVRLFRSIAGNVEHQAEWHAFVRAKHQKVPKSDE
jgi:transcriptional regulator with XRE-family HTH domain